MEIGENLNFPVTNQDMLMKLDRRRLPHNTITLADVSILENIATVNVWKMSDTSRLKRR